MSGSLKQMQKAGYASLHTPCSQGVQRMRSDQVGVGAGVVVGGTADVVSGSDSDSEALPDHDSDVDLESVAVPDGVPDPVAERVWLVDADSDSEDENVCVSDSEMESEGVISSERVMGWVLVSDSVGCVILPVTDGVDDADRDCV